LFANFNVLKGRPGRYGKPGLRGLPGLGVKGDKGEQGLRGLPGQVFVSQVASYDNLLFYLQRIFLLFYYSHWCSHHFFLSIRLSVRFIWTPE